MVQQRRINKEKLPDVSEILPIFKLAPLSEEEIAFKKDSRMKWTEEGPSFGCDFNRVTPPRSLRSTR
jgi:hypothetical protein